MLYSTLPTNRGCLHTSKGGRNGVNMGKNGVLDLSVKIDWLAFCLNKCEVEEALEFLGLDCLEFLDLRHGGRGYRKMLQHADYDINVYFSGEKDMGTHFEVKGSAVYFFIDMVMRGKFGEKNPFDDEKLIDWDLDSVAEIFRLILSCGWFTRIDIAIDDIGTKFFSCEKLIKLLDSRCYVGKFKRYDKFISQDASGNMTGCTVYLGSRENSDMFIRVYDKYLEQLCMTSELTCDSWVRWEVVLKDDKADIFAGYIVDGLEFGYCVRSVLSGYVRFIRQDDLNRSRCSVLPKWLKFIDCMEGISLSIPREHRTVERAVEWVKRQVLPTLSGITIAQNYDLSFLEDHLEENFARLSQRDQQMFLKYGGLI